MDFYPNNFINQQHLSSLFSEKSCLMRQEDKEQLPLIPIIMFPFQSPILFPTTQNNHLVYPNANSHHFHDNTILNVENTYITPGRLMESPPPPTSFNTNNVSPSGVSTYSFGESSSHNNPDVLFAPNNSLPECALFLA
jgi:hypothetical protein